MNSKEYEYAYDNIGNRQQATEGNDVTVYDANALNQYTSISENGDAAFIPQFDVDGNQTLIKTDTGIWSALYNAENRPVSFTNSESNTVVECQYDSMGRRAYKKVTVNGNVTLHQCYIYRGYLQIACIDLTRSHHPVMWLVTWDPTQPVATRPLAIRINGTWYTYGWDLTKNICELYSTEGRISTSYTYSPFGKVTATGSLTQPIQWSSEIWDSELGLMYYNWRYYNAAVGRWIQKDFITSKRAYTLINNSTVLLSDYLGLFCGQNQTDNNILTNELRVHTPHGGSYDLILKEKQNKECELIVFMKLQFYFVDKDKLKWNREEKQKFVSDWEREVKKAWEGRHTLSAPETSCICKSGIHVKLSFESQIEGFMYDHWEIYVKKTESYNQSLVYMKNGRAELDSQDLTPENKGGMSFKQRGAIHEFGHMLGLLDEYEETNGLKEFIHDKKSVMNYGEIIRERHYQYLKKWIDEKLTISQG